MGVRESQVSGSEEQEQEQEQEQVSPPSNCDCRFCCPCCHCCCARPSLPPHCRLPLCCSSRAGKLQPGP